jgi:hypothetical protein
MTNNLLPFDPKLAKSWANPDGLDVFHENAMNPGDAPITFIGMRSILRGYVVYMRYGSSELHKCNSTNLRLRPRMVKKMVYLFPEGFWRFDPDDKMQSIADVIPVEIDVQEG